MKKNSTKAISKSDSSKHKLKSHEHHLNNRSYPSAKNSSKKKKDPSKKSTTMNWKSRINKSENLAKKLRTSNTQKPTNQEWERIPLIKRIS